VSASGTMAALWREILDVELPLPFPRLTYAEALDRYGTDKPDLRFGMPFIDVTDVLQQADFRLFRTRANRGAHPRRIVVSGGAACRAQLDELAGVAKAPARRRALGEAHGRRPDGPVREGARRGLTAGSSRRRRWPRATCSSPSSAISGWPCRASGDRSAGAGRRGDRPRRAAPHLGDVRGLRPRAAHSWVWVTGFPLFEWDAGGRLAAAHHPFTAPHAEDAQAVLDATRTARHGDAAWQLYTQGPAIPCVRCGVQRPRDGQRLDPYPRCARCSARCSRRWASPPTRRSAVRLPARGVPVRRAAACRLRVRLRPAGHAAGRGAESARRDRIPEDDGGARTVRGRAIAGGGGRACRAAHPDPGRKEWGNWWIARLSSTGSPRRAPTTCSWPASTTRTCRSSRGCPAAASSCAATT
jgi:hypothetical protein